MKAVILAGGRGTRLRPYTKILPKPLMPIGDMPILEIILRQMKQADVTDAILTVGHLAEYLRLFFQDGQRVGLNISYSYEGKPLGTAGPLTLVKGLDETFLVSNGDVLTTMDMAALISFHRQNGAVATIAMHHRQVKIDLGVIQLNGSHEVEGYLEKPTYDYMVSMGIYVFEPEVLAYIPSNSYFDFPDLVHKLLAEGQKVVGFPFDGYWQDLGRADDYEQAIRDFDRMRAEFLPGEAG
ncbi:MAG: sugar phosphate nucleotidyltransferase [Anaerolineae bacterium]